MEGRKTLHKPQAARAPGSLVQLTPDQTLQNAKGQLSWPILNAGTGRLKLRKSTTKSQSDVMVGFWAPQENGFAQIPKHIASAGCAEP